MNVARMTYIGMGKLCYTEEQVFNMTPRKFFKVYNEYLIMNGHKKDGDEYVIDNLA